MLGVYPASSMTVSTLRFVSSVTKRVLLITCDTVAVDTPARRAMSLILVVFIRKVFLSRFAGTLGMDPRGPTAPGCQGNFQLGFAIDLLLRFLVVARVAFRVHSVLIGLHHKVSFGQKRQVQIEFARRPVGHRADVPIAPISAGHGHV